MSDREQFEAEWTAAGWGSPDTKAQCLHFWQASRRAALEEAAKVCEDLEVDRWNLYKGRAPYTGSEDGRANSYVEGESDGAGKCGVAIRALANGDQS